MDQQNIVYPKPDNFYRCWCKEQVLHKRKAKVVRGTIHLFSLPCRVISPSETKESS